MYDACDMASDCSWSFYEGKPVEEISQAYIFCPFGLLRPDTPAIQYEQLEVHVLVKTAIMSTTMVTIGDAKGSVA